MVNLIHTYNLLILFSVVILVSNTTKSKFDTDYHTKSDSQYKAGKALIEQLHLKGNERVLDVGCATGRTTNECAKRLPSGSVLGIDVSKEVISFAQNEYANIPNVSFQCMDAASTPFDEEFDFIYSFYCLHWVPNQSEAIKKIAQSLKPGGNALLLISSPCNATKIWDASCENIAKKYPQWRDDLTKHYFLQSPDTWIKWCNQANLIVDDHEIKEKTTVFKTINDFKKHVKALGIGANLEEKEREQLIDMVSNEYYDQCDQEKNQSFDFITHALLLKLSK